jgi:signal transduction histidine kinase
MRLALPNMAGLGRFFRTTAVKLSLTYLVAFTIFVLFLVGYISHATSNLLTEQLREAVDAEVRGLRNQYDVGGMQRVAFAIDSLSRRPGAGLYVLADASGNLLVGNVSDIPTWVLDAANEQLRPVDYTRSDDEGVRTHHVALVRVFTLDNGFRVLVGRDVGERERFRGIIRQAFRAIIIVMILLGGITWWFVSRRVLKRIDQVTATSQRIVAGDLSGRLPVAGTGDEFDRLAESLNGMLTRIDELMRGLKEVSDNIAHDLKTPLTRMRNRVEGALAGASDVDAYRGALERTIDECDGLIKTFDALLTIARVESGNRPVTMERLDAAGIAAEVAELYEPVAEEEGVALSLQTEPAEIVGSRELLAQALANLVDNALKYGRAADRPAEIRLSVRRIGTEVALSVADNGPGIPAADRERVLGRFVRLEASRSAPGSGLGLALVAAIAHQHGAHLRLDDAAPGLMVTLSLPSA